jgi:hypothetical protein
VAAVGHETTGGGEVSAKRKTIPKRTRRLEKARRLVAGLWRDVTGKPKPGKKGNPWQRCEACHRRQPPSAYLCGWVTHAEMCTGCCGYPHPEDDDEETAAQTPVRDEDDEDEEDAHNDHHHH